MLIGTTANKKFPDGSIPRESRRVRTDMTKGVSHTCVRIYHFTAEASRASALKIQKSGRP